MHLAMAGYGPDAIAGQVDRRPRVAQTREAGERVGEKVVVEGVKIGDRSAYLALGEPALAGRRPCGSAANRPPDVVATSTA
jgi:hypothetical protein